MKSNRFRKVFSAIFILIYLLTAPGVLVAPARATDYGSSVTVESGETFQPGDGIANITGSLTNKNGGIVIADTIKTTAGWTLEEGSVTQVNTLTNGTDLTAMSQTGTVNGDVYASSGTLDMRGVDLRLKGDPLLHGGTVENPTTLDTLKATRVLFGDIYEGGNTQTIKNIVLENYTAAYRAALGVYYDSLTVDKISVDAPEGWYWDQQYQLNNYQMYTGYSGVLNVNESITSGEIMVASSSLGYTGTLNLADGAVANCLDFQNTGNVTEETLAAGTVHVNGAGATLNAAALNNHAITTLGTVNLTSHPVHTTATSELYSVNYGTDAELTIGQLNFLNKQGDTTKNQMRFGDNAKTIIGGLTTNPAVGADFYVTQESDMSINKDGGNAVQYTGDIVFTTYGNAASDNTKVSMNLDSSDDYFTGAVKGTVTSSDRWGKWRSGVVGGETASTEHIKGMTLNLSNGATWNVTGDSYVNNLTVDGGNVLGGNDKTVTIADNGTLSSNATVATNVTNAGTLTVKDSATISNTLTNNGVLNLSDATHTVGTNLSVDTFTGSATGSIDFDADISGTKQDTDYITVTTAASGDIKLGHVNIKADAPTTEGKTLALFRKAAGNTDFSGLVITGNATTQTSTGNIYSFVQDTSANDKRGNLVGTYIAGSYTLPEIVQNRKNTTISTEYEPGNITTYSLTSDYTAPETLGTLTNVSDQTTRELAIYGNGNNLSGGGYAGITVNSNGTLILKDINSFGGFSDSAVNNAGTLTIEDVNVGNNIENTGTVVLNGINEFNAAEESDITNNGTGTITFGNGSTTNFSKGVSGINELTIAAAATVNFLDGAKNSVAINNEGTVSAAGTTFNANVTNSGNLAATANTTFSANVENSGTMVATDTSFNDITNTGTMVASDTTFNQGLTSTGANAVATLYDATLTGGTYTAKDSGKIVMESGTVDGKTKEIAANFGEGHQARGFILNGSSILDTTSNKVFTNALTTFSGDISSETDRTTYVTANADSGAVINSLTQIDFRNGNVQLNDAHYTLGYASTAKGALSNASSLGEGNGKTNVIMTGDLVTAGGVNTATVQDLGSEALKGVALDKVTGTTIQGSLLVGQTSITAAQHDALQTSTGIDIKDTTAISVNIDKIELAAAATGVIITNNEAVTLGGASGRDTAEASDIIKVKTKEVADVNVVVGLDKATASTLNVKQEGVLNVGNANATDNSKYLLSGDVTVNDTSGEASNKSEINIEGQAEIAGNLTLSGANVTIGSYNPGSTLSIGGTTTVKAAGTEEVPVATTIAGTIHGNKLVNDGTLQAKASDLQYTTIENNSIHTLILGDGAIAADITTTEADGRGAVTVNGAVTATGKTIKNQNVTVNATKALTLTNGISDNTSYANAGTLKLMGSNLVTGSVSGEGNTNVEGFSFVDGTVTTETNVKGGLVSTDKTAVGYNNRFAGTSTNSIAIGNNNNISHNSSVVIGNNITTEADDTVAIGTGANATAQHAVALGANNAEGDYSFATGWGNTASGKGAFVAGGVGGNATSGWKTKPNIASGRNAVAMGAGNGASGNESFAMGEYNCASGGCSVAMGYRSCATGDSAIAMGNGVNASGIHSVAMGIGTTAEGNYSVAIGEHTNAAGESSMATGVYTNASGYGSTSMGVYTNAIGKAATAMGAWTMARGDGSTSMGVGTISSGNYSTAMGYNTNASGFASFAIGQNSNASGSNSISMGYQTYATNNYSTAMGFATNASGQYSTAMGRETFAKGQASTAMGWKTNASGINSTAMGYHTCATGYYSTAMGYETCATEIYSTAMGFATNASGYASTAMGQNSNASGDYSVSTGYGNTANGQGSFAAGGVGLKWSEEEEKYVPVSNGNTASGRNAVALGEGSTASGVDSFAMGKNVNASGLASVAMGEGTNATNDYSVAMGYRTNASGCSSTAMGENTTASGESSVAMGASTTASGAVSTAMGLSTTASGHYSTAMGSDTTASGLASTAIGAFTEATGAASFAGGVDTSLGQGTGTKTYATGNASFAYGVGVNASGDASVAFGFGNTANGQGSFAAGGVGGEIVKFSMPEHPEYTETVTLPLSNKVTGTNGVAFGSGNGVQGNGGFAGGNAEFEGVYEHGTTEEGEYDELTGVKINAANAAIGENSFAYGAGVRSGGTADVAYNMDEKTVEWSNVDKTGDYTVAMGYKAQAYKDYAVAMGNNTNASGVASFAIGQNSNASGNYSVAMGLGTTALGDYSVAMGFGTTALDAYSTAMGYQTCATGMVSTAMGYQTCATGTASTAMGCDTYATEKYSTAMGYETNASGYASTATGWGNTANGSGSFAAGGMGGEIVIKRDPSGTITGTLSLSNKVTGTNGVAFGSGNVVHGNGGFAGGNAEFEGVYKEKEEGGYELTGVKINAANAAIGENSFAYGAGVRSGGTADVVYNMDEETVEWSNVEKTGDYTVAMGYKTVAYADYSVAMGNGAIASGRGSVAFGSSKAGTAYQHAGEPLTENVKCVDGAWREVTITPNETVTSGDYSIATGNSTAYGKYSTAQGNSQTGYAYNTDQAAYDTIKVVYDENGLAELNEDGSVKTTLVPHDATTITKAVGGEYATASGKDAKAYGNYSVAMGDGAQTGEVVLKEGSTTDYEVTGGESAVAMGKNTNAAGNYSVAMGEGTTASGEYSTAMGNNTTASGEAATAMGASTTASGVESTAMGLSTTASGHYSTAMGVYTMAKGDGSFAGGVGVEEDLTTPAPAQALGTSSFAYGTGVTSGAGHMVEDPEGAYWKSDAGYTVAMGYKTGAYKDYAVAMGNQTNASGNSAVAMGAGTTASGLASTAIGAFSQATGAASFAGGVDTSFGLGEGTKTNASGNASFAYGVGVNASGDAAVAFGFGNNASGQGAFTAGGVKDATTMNANTASGRNAVAFGEGSTASGDDSFAMGKDVNASGLASVAMGEGTNATSSYATAMGNNTTASGWASTAMGDQTTASSYASTAMGAYTTASGKISTATGAYTVASGVASFAGGMDTTGIGEGTLTTASGTASFAYGAGVTSGKAESTEGAGDGADYTVAMGYNTSAVANYAVAMGKDANAAAANSFAFGGTVATGATNGVALGQGSSVTGANSVALGADSVASGANEVSVGKAGATRKITNVTAGDISSTSTDVVVGSQLNATNKSVATNTANIATNTANIGTLQGYFNAQGKALNAVAAEAAVKATQDENGNNIVATYATKSEVTAGTEYVKATKHNATGEVPIVAADTATSGGATAVGYNTRATGNYSTAVGWGANATGEHAVAVGASGAHGNYSFATGLDNNATGIGAFAAGGVGYREEGEFAAGNTASGRNAAAFGEGNTASGINSFAMGDRVNASGENSFAGGSREWPAGADETKTLASGRSSFAFGGAVCATANFAVAMGNTTNASGNASFAIGQGSKAAANYSVAMGLGNNATASGAFAAGGVGYYQESEFVAGNTASGRNAAVFGEANTASGIDSFAIGDNVTASGDSSFAGGSREWPAGAGETKTLASGKSSFAFGGAVCATANYAVAMGNTTNASGEASFAIGQGSKAAGNYSVAMGWGNTANASGAFAAGGVGYYGGEYTASNTASGRNAAVFGEANTASGIDSFAIGDSVTASGDNSFAGGSREWPAGAGETKTLASGKSSFAFGGAVCATANYAVAMGNTTNASGEASFAIGQGSKAAGNYSVAMGQNAEANEANSFALGGTVAEGATNGVALGQGASVTGTATNSVALGAGSVASAANEVSVGKAGDGGFTRKISNVAAQTLAENGTYAATTGQVYAEQEARKTATTMSAKGNYYAKDDSVTTALGKVDTQVAANTTAIGTKANQSDFTAHTGNTTAHITSAERTAWSAYDGRITTNTGNISTLHGYFTDGVANKAAADAYGNDINTSYAKKATTLAGYGITDAYTMKQVDEMIGSGGKLAVAYTDETKTAIKLSGEGGTTISNVKAQALEKDGTYAATTGQVYTEQQARIAASVTQGAVSGSSLALKNAAGTEVATVDMSALTTTQGNTNAENITKIVNGSTVVGKATADADGNVITATYATKAAIADGTIVAGTAANYSANGTIATELNKKADKSYVNEELAKKANAADVYTKTDADAKFATTEAVADTYATKTELKAEETRAKAAETVTVSGGKNINTGSGINFVAGSTNVKITGENGTITIDAVGATDTGAVRYDTDPTTGARLNSVTFKSAEGTTDKVLLKNAELESSSAETGGSTAKIADGKVTVVNTESGTGTTITSTDITLSGGKDGVLYTSKDKGISENIQILDKQVTMISANQSGMTITEAHDNAASATKAEATAVGYKAQATAASATAVGYGNKVSGVQSTAVGYKNEVSGSHSGAFGDPNYVTGDGSYAFGNNNNISGNNTFVLGNNVTTNASNSVALGNGSVIGGNNEVSVGSAGNERKITNVAAGTVSATSTDAVNGSQLYSMGQAVIENQRQLAETSKEVKEVGAISAALAGLHYVEPSGEGDDKFTGAVAYGGYRGQSAAAVGVAYKPSPNLMVSASTSVGNSQNAYNAGISYKFGKGETAATRAGLVKQVKYVNEENKKLKEENAQMKETLKNVLDRLEKLEKKQ